MVTFNVNRSKISLMLPLGAKCALAGSFYLLLAFIQPTPAVGSHNCSRWVLGSPRVSKTSLVMRLQRGIRAWLELQYHCTRAVAVASTDLLGSLDEDELRMRHSKI
jgi:hypothetical protein